MSGALPAYVPTLENLVTPATVTLSTKETHDDEGCECISGTVTLAVGDTLVLTHVCNDGRVDRIVAQVLAISLPPPAKDIP